MRFEGCVSAGAAGVGEIGLATARALGESDAVGLLEKNLKEDKETLREVESIGKRLAKESAKEMAQA